MTASDLNDYLTLGISGCTLAGILYLAWRKQVWRRLVNWTRSVKARKQATEAMVNSFPTVFEFVADSKNREDKSAAREVRVTAEFAGLREHLERQDAKLEAIMAQQWGAMKLDPQARFICANDGRNEQVNTAYASMLRVGEASLKGFGYKNYIDPAQLPTYIAEVMQAMKEHRRFASSVVMIRGDGSRFLAHVRLEPYPEDPSMGEASHWFGAVTVIQEIEK